MPDYSIFVLGESQMTISGGEQLDGVNQGSGVHMQGQTITLDSNAWEEIQITDDDANFQDSDGSQRLDGAQTLDGVPYADNSVVEAEYSLTVTDGVDTWTVIGFNINNSNPSYGTVEGLAFIGGPGGFPPTGVPLTVVATGEGPSFAAASYATPICYDRGTLILTDRGLRPIESLRVGDKVQTADSGVQPIRWIGGRHVVGAGRFAPVELGTGVMGAIAPLRVSQQHRILVSDPQVELLFGQAEVFVPAIHLVDGVDIRLLQHVRAQYFHLILERHEVIYANGVASESLHCAEASPEGDAVSDLMEIERFFPEVADLPMARAQLARRSLRRREAAVLLRRMMDRADIERGGRLRHTLPKIAARPI